MAGIWGLVLPKREPKSERSILERIARAFPAHAGAGSGFVELGIGDDAALVHPTPGYESVLTCDWFLEGTHFLRDNHPADAVGWKCLARAVSDVAAMAAVPRCFLLSLALPAELAGAWLDEFLEGLKRAASKFECPLAGGDTTSNRRILINVTVVGDVRRGLALRRSGARPGDIIYVSGRLGEAELGLRLLRDGKRRVTHRDERLQKHLYPEPRLELGRWLSEKRLATAMMDLSDGLSSDLRRMCEASGVGAVVDGTRLPAVQVSERERASVIDPLELALHGGDDYELLFTVAKRNAARVPGSVGKIKITAIGEITRSNEIKLVDNNGRTSILPAGGWDPFR